MSGACAVAFVDRRELPLWRWSSLLSSKERAEAASYRHPVRRARTITSRVLTKHLVMNPEVPEFRRLRAEEIDVGRGSEWASIELLSGTAKAGGTTVIREGKAATDVSVSSSHCGAYTASCISRNHVGLDLELIEPRRREFYAYTFSPEERGWAESVHGTAGTSMEAAFTLLWTVKEAYLKACARDDVSIWSFPGWTVWFEGTVDGALRSKSQGEFTRVLGGIRGRSFSSTFEIATMRIYDMILSTVQYQKSGRWDATVGSVR